MKIFIASISAIAIIAFAFMIAQGVKTAVPSGPDISNNGNNVSIVDGKQIIDITAKGGYTPAKSTAKAGIPTEIRFTTNGTFDCSSSVRIPSINLFKSLSLSGITSIDLGNPKAGILQGSCGMGMYPFQIDFQS